MNFNNQRSKNLLKKPTIKKAENYNQLFFCIYCKVILVIMSEFTGLKAINKIDIKYIRNIFSNKLLQLETIFYET